MKIKGKYGYLMTCLTKELTERDFLATFNKGNKGNV